jgi:hypothetical protein
MNAKRKPGRPLKMTPLRVAIIFNAIADGANITQALRSPASTQAHTANGQSGPGADLVRDPNYRRYGQKGSPAETDCFSGISPTGCPPVTPLLPGSCRKPANVATTPTIGFSISSTITRKHGAGCSLSAPMALQMPKTRKRPNKGSKLRATAGS